MPIHDWRGVPVNGFHAFHLSWVTRLAGELNRELLSPEFYALPERIATRAETARLARLGTRPPHRVTIRRVSDHRVIALIEIVSLATFGSRFRITIPEWELSD